MANRVGPLADQRSEGTDQATGLPRARAALRRWLAHNDGLLASYRHGHTPDIGTDVEHEQGLLRLLFDAGWSRLGWPESVGGLGGDARHRALLYDELARADVVLPEAFVLLETLAPPLVHYAPDIAQRHLPAYLSGAELWGQGFSEPEAGSDLASVRTSARRTAGGYVVNGQKIWTSLGQYASWAMALCRTGTAESRHRGLSMLWIDLAAPGVQVRPITAANGRDEFAEMFFADVTVPRDRLIGRENEGWAVAMYLLQYERGMYAWGRQAALHTALRRALTTPTAAPRHATTAVGQAFTTLTALRARTATTVAKLAAGEVVGPEASVDKILLSRAEQQTHDAIRLLSPQDFLLGDTAGAVSKRLGWFYSRATSIFGGAVEIQRGIVAERVLGLPRTPSGH